MKSLIVVYDGSCGLCSGGMVWIARLDWFGVVSAVPLQSEALYRQVAALDSQACLATMHAVLPGGRIRVGGDAWRAILARLPLTTPLAVLLAIPPLPALVRACYPWMAARRQAISLACGLRAGGQPGRVMRS